MAIKERRAPSATPIRLSPGRETGLILSKSPAQRVRARARIHRGPRLCSRFSCVHNVGRGSREFSLPRRRERRDAIVPRLRLNYSPGGMCRARNAERSARSDCGAAGVAGVGIGGSRHSPKPAENEVTFVPKLIFEHKRAPPRE